MYLFKIVITLIYLYNIKKICARFIFGYNKSMDKRLLWIFEISFWLIIIGIIAGTIVFFVNEHKKATTTYQIVLPDVDGLIVGSPVKFMGINIGYVKKIEMIEDRVYLKFIVTKPNTKLPVNTIATVEFYGLGGSKSLELYPPQEGHIAQSEIIIAQPPKRIGDSLALLLNMFDDMSEITYNVSNFMAKTGVIKKKPSHSNVLDRANYWVDKTHQQLDKINYNNNKEAGENHGKDFGKIEYEYD